MFDNPVITQITPTTTPTFGIRPVNGGPYAGRRFAYNVEHYTYTPKLNGWQVLVHIPSLACFNRQGLPLSIASEFEHALASVNRTLDSAAFRWAVFEGLERRHGIGKGTLILLDVIPNPEHSDAGHADRSLWVPPSVVPVLKIGQEPEPDSLYQLQKFAYSGLDAAWRRMREVNDDWGCEFYEGVVAANDTSPFPMQLRNPEETSTAYIKHRWSWK